MRYRDPNGSDVSIEMTMTTRGRSRLAYCRFPPLKVNLKKSQTAGTLFEGQNKLKIVTHCRNGSVHQRYLSQEFGIYKAYNQLSDYSFRARWITARYKDSERRGSEETHPAFFIESNRGIAKRTGRERIEINRVPAENLDPVESTKYALFQYLVANTDWSMVKGPGDEGCCHNGKLLAEPGTQSGWVVVPYDYDQSGIINTKYAVPAEALRIRSVRQRLYRGRCMHNPELAGVIDLFVSKRTDIEERLAPASLGDRAQRSALNYINSFYETIATPGDVARKLSGACIGK